MHADPLQACYYYPLEVIDDIRGFMYLCRTWRMR